MSILSELRDDVKFVFSYRKRHMQVQKRLDKKAPKVGDLAPDFTISDVRGENTVTLSGFRNKRPVALVFGSFT